MMENKNEKTKINSSWFLLESRLYLYTHIHVDGKTTRNLRKGLGVSSKDRNRIVDGIEIEWMVGWYQTPIYEVGYTDVH